MHNLSESYRSEDVIKKEEQIAEELDEWLLREELMWKQRARSDWLRSGERNTVFFKAKASRRRERKIIGCVEKNDGSRVYESNQIMNEFITYFNSLFSPSVGVRQVNWNTAMSTISPRVTSQMNAKLTEPYTEEEVRRALFQMHPDKAPGTDGFPALFYQKFWSLVKYDVVKEVLNFLNNGSLDEKLNETQIILLPKKKEAAKVEDFRPISLCNVSMKLRLSSCLGFDRIWVEKVMKCVESVSYRLKVNGDKSEIIKPSRGLRQGDPLSPYLFIICQEWLSASLNKKQEMKKIEGICIARGIQPLNHLFFADDCLLFVKAELKQLIELKELLNLFECVAGQKGKL